MSEEKCRICEVGKGQIDTGEGLVCSGCAADILIRLHDGNMMGKIADESSPGQYLAALHAIETYRDYLLDGEATDES